MALPEAAPPCSLDADMAWKAEQAERHEHLNGEVFAMTGARDAPNTIAAMKSRADTADAVLHPAVLVTRDPRDKAPEADTANERGIKFEHGRAIDAPREQLPKEPGRRHADRSRRGEHGHGVLEPIGDLERIESPAPCTALRRDELDEDVDFRACSESVDTILRGGDNRTPAVKSVAISWFTTLQVGTSKIPSHRRLPVSGSLIPMNAGFFRDDTAGMFRGAHIPFVGFMQWASPRYASVWTGLVRRPPTMPG